jgi:hypothetical protein
MRREGAKRLSSAITCDHLRRSEKTRICFTGRRHREEAAVGRNWAVAGIRLERGRRRKSCKMFRAGWKQAWAEMMDAELEDRLFAWIDAQTITYCLSRWSRRHSL